MEVMWKLPLIFNIFILMALGKRKRGSRRPKSRKRRKTSHRKPLPISGFPRQKVCRLRYVQQFQLSPTLVCASKNFNANGMYDPDHSTGGHQPKGFDEWMNVYSHFNVLGSKCTVKCTDSNAGNFVYGIARVGGPNEMSGQSLEYILESRMAGKYRIAANMGTTDNMGNFPNKGITQFYSQKKIHGKNSTSRSDLLGSISHNPSEITCFEVWCCPTEAAGTAQCQGVFIITIDYIALFTEPKVLAQS